METKWRIWVERDVVVVVLQEDFREGDGEGSGKGEAVTEKEQGEVMRGSLVSGSDGEGEGDVNEGKTRARYSRRQRRQESRRHVTS